MIEDFRGYFGPRQGRFCWSCLAADPTFFLAADIFIGRELQQQYFCFMVAAGNVLKTEQSFFWLSTFNRRPEFQLASVVVKSELKFFRLK